MLLFLVLNFKLLYNRIPSILKKIAPMRKLLIIFTVLALLGFGVILGVLNPDLIRLNLFWVELSLPLGLVLAFSLVVGTLFSMLIFGLKLQKLKWVLRRQIKKNQKQSNQILELKKRCLNQQGGTKSPSNYMISKVK